MTGKRGWIAALLISLILNGVMVGVYIGQFYAGRDHMVMREMSRKILKKAPSEFTDMISQAMRKHKSDLRAGYRELRRARRDMMALLQSETVTREELREGFARIRAADEKLKREVHDVLAEVLPDVPAQHRLELSMWEHRKGDRPPKGGPHRSPEPGQQAQ